MRIDRFIKKAIRNIPQGLIEKNLRTGKIKLNGKNKVPTELKKNILNFFNLNFYANIENKKTLYKPSKKILKSNEKLIIENNDDFVISKDSGISVQGGTKSNRI